MLLPCHRGQRPRAGPIAGAINSGGFIVARMQDVQCGKNQMPELFADNVRSYSSIARCRSAGMREYNCHVITETTAHGPEFQTG
jgi:hypothetical protein